MGLVGEQPLPFFSRRVCAVTELCTECLQCGVQHSTEWKTAFLRCLCTAIKVSVFLGLREIRGHPPSNLPRPNLLLNLTFLYLPFLYLDCWYQALLHLTFLYVTFSTLPHRTQPSFSHSYA